MRKYDVVFKGNFRIHKTIFFVWVVFLIALFVSMHTNIAAAITEHSGYARLIEVCIAAGIFLEYKILNKMTEQCSSCQMGIRIFVTAFAVRILTLPFSQYMPTNDFANYYEGACYFAEHGLSGGLYEPLAAYGIPTFAGQAAINGWLLRIFSPTLLGMQIVNCIYTAGICFLIYELGKELESSAGLAGACIYTFYPMGVLSAHITTNTHGAAFFMLQGFYFFRKASKAGHRKKGVLYLSVCALCFVASNLYHPSAMIILCGLFVYSAGCELESVLHLGVSYRNKIISDIKQFQGNLIYTIFTVVFYCAISSGLMMVIKEGGDVNNILNHTYLMKIVWGLNQESDGAWNRPDIEEISSYPPEIQRDACIRIIRERLQDPYAVLKLMGKKTQLAWFGADNYDYFYLDGISMRYETYKEGITDQEKLDYLNDRQTSAYHCLWNISNANNLFIYVIWMLAVIGILALLRKHEESNLAYLLLYIPFGWMAFILISEMQSRYRYQGMTVIILFAGYGGVVLKKAFRGFTQKHKNA